jgi:hypothetical protein
VKRPRNHTRPTQRGSAHQTRDRFDRSVTLNGVRRSWRKADSLKKGRRDRPLGKSRIVAFLFGRRLGSYSVRTSLGRLWRLEKLFFWTSESAACLKLVVRELGNLGEALTQLVKRRFGCGESVQRRTGGVMAVGVSVIRWASAAYNPQLEGLEGYMESVEWLRLYSNRVFLLSIHDASHWHGKGS